MAHGHKIFIPIALKEDVRNNNNNITVCGAICVHVWPNIISSER